MKSSKRRSRHNRDEIDIIKIQQSQSYSQRNVEKVKEVGKSLMIEEQQLSKTKIKKEEKEWDGGNIVGSNNEGGGSQELQLQQLQKKQTTQKPPESASKHHPSTKLRVKKQSTLKRQQKQQEQEQESSRCSQLRFKIIDKKQEWHYNQYSKKNLKSVFWKVQYQDQQQCDVEWKVMRQIKDKRVRKAADRYCRKELSSRYRLTHHKECDFVKIFDRKLMTYKKC